MSQVIQLASTPNQTLNFTWEGVRYALRLYACFDCMAVDVSINDNPVIRGQRVVAGGFFLPYVHEFFGRGNFAVLTNNDEIPYYDQFGVTQTLIFYTPQEAAQLYG